MCYKTKFISLIKLLCDQEIKRHVCLQQYVLTNLRAIASRKAELSCSYTKIYFEF